MHTPLIAASTGLALCSSARITLSRLGSARALGELNSRMSAPPEKTLPAPVSTMARSAGSALARSSASVSATRVA